MNVLLRESQNLSNTLKSIPVMQHESSPRKDVIHTQLTVAMIMYVAMKLLHRCVKQIFTFERRTINDGLFNRYNCIFIRSYRLYDKAINSR